MREEKGVAILADRIKQAEDVVWRRIGDDIVVIKDDGLSTHVLNKTAAIIWEMSDGGCGIEEIASYIYRHFDVSLEEARADVIGLVETLTTRGIIIYL
jgi:hypothetical protein